MILIILVVALKFIIPSLMFWNPLVGSWGNYFLDVVDGDILLELGLSDFNYQTIDKFADLFSYAVMLLVGLKWSIRRTIIYLFIYRFIGQILFFLTRNEMMFFYFQNLLEPLVMAYSILLFRNKWDDKKAFLSYKKHFILIWIIVIGYKIWNEWYLHFANIDLSTIFFGFSGGM